tara:strand:- start:86 stop:511 length:426 start_codon:yes stop_codon:yes gene_type:complete
MGKRRRRLYSPKYAKKYASVREKYFKLRGIIKEAEEDGIITPEEGVRIKEAKEELVQTTVDTTVDEVKEIVEEVKETIEEVIKDPDPPKKIKVKEADPVTQAPKKVKKATKETKKKKPALNKAPRRATNRRKSEDKTKSPN